LHGELSKIVSFFLKHGGIANVIVTDNKYHHS